jgi:hypothetical protein
MLGRLASTLGLAFAATLLLVLGALRPLAAIGPEAPAVFECVPGNTGPEARQSIGIYVRIVGPPHSARVNWYAYCEGDPINRWDPSGLLSLAWHMRVSAQAMDETGFAPAGVFRTGVLIGSNLS